MAGAFTHSLSLYWACLKGSFSTSAQALAPLGVRRLTLLLLGFPLFILLQLTHWIGFALDELFFRGYRKVRIKRPLFITGLPRSGTTFVHRTIAADTTQFTSFRTWEAVLAPSITERRFWKILAAVDQFVGSPLKHSLDFLIRKATGDFEEVHSVGLDAAEEDYLTLLPAGACFILVLAFPFESRLWQMAQISSCPEKYRQAILDYYLTCLRKHLYVEGKDGKRLLSKNAAFATWVPFLRQKLPDARFLICIRDPLDGLSSQLSSISGGCHFFGTSEGFETICRQFEHTFQAGYQTLKDETLNAPRKQISVIDQGELKQAPGGVLRDALLHLEEELSPALTIALEEVERTSKNHQSTHRHTASDFGFSKVTIEPCLLEDYRTILSHRANCSAPADLPPPSASNL